MNLTAFFKYYIDINFLNLVFSIILIISSGAFWATVNFSSLGILIGFWGYHLFKEQEYYMYYNLGFTKRKLLLLVWITNMLISVPILGLIFLFQS
ncbi:hypothetical protein [uncultured Tenacibaculum sp.]|uniref:hypothetical protein n=1 Tax=uncultured Tenacibaculum sp. TaxID=174713 RepID=UPI0026300036|nr:hypothetical protein [uncultured Tenacibaculum sp.]